ncbi:hypothetical protein AB0O91_20980 [Kitasatospora sp. NPDC089797]|uniref:hypothetical protein n=1 Tax=Kitasatospora sp. NPDC089797 TaxID=3155298 RepID=UPI00341EF594
MGPVTLTWYGCDLRTGRIAEELPALTPAQPLSRRLGAVTTTSFDLALAGAPPAWQPATDPGRTLLVAVDATTGVPLWSGIPLTRAGGSADTVAITASTPECYLDRRYTAYTGTGVDLSTAMAQVAQPLLTQGPPFAVDSVPSGTLGNYTVQDSDDKTVLSCLQEIDAMSAAPEWTIDTVWANAAQTAVQLVLRIRPQIGVQSARPEAQFDLPGCVTDYTLTESYERGRGATSATARGETQGNSRITSAPHTAASLIADGWCLWEYRYQPASGITDTSQLDAHATEALGLLQLGSAAWTVHAAASAAPRLGTDWALGDSIAVNIASSQRHPTGATTVARAYAWELDAENNTVSPILLEDQ